MTTEPVDLSLPPWVLPPGASAELIDLRDRAMRFIDHYFRNGAERPRLSIPARPDDDDLALLAGLNGMAATIARLTAERDAARGALEDIACGRGMEGVSMEDDLHWAMTHALASLPPDRRAALTDGEPRDDA